jgi:hypothetical protein
VRCGEAEAGVRFIGPGSGVEEGRWPAAVEFYSSSVSKELKGEEEMGWHRFSGGSEGGMTVLQFGSSRVKEGGSRRCMARRCGRRGGGADGSHRWEPMPCWVVPGQKVEWSGPVSVGVKERRKWVERRNGPKAKEATT